MYKLAVLIITMLIQQEQKHCVSMLMETRLHSCRLQPVGYPLPFKIIYTNIVLRFFVVAQALRDFKDSTILVYIIINNRGSLNGCGQHGCSNVPFLLNRSIQNSCLFSN